ncbi:MAG: hypothetical protein R2681_00765 [Pyrinomonadaceae bacterium]
MSEIEFNTNVIKPVECYKEGWQLIKGQYWLLFGVTIIGAMIGGMSMYVLIGAMICGIFLCFFKAIDGEQVQFEDLFKGFRYFFPSLFVTILIIVPTLVVFALMYAPLIMASVMGTRLSEEEIFALLAGTFAVDFVVAIIMVCFHTLLVFAYPLIVDKNLSGVAAVRLSIRSVWKNLRGVAGLWGIGFLISLLGILLCFVGTYFTIPIIIAGNVVAYRKIFPADRGTTDRPPSPEIYIEPGNN